MKKRKKGSSFVIVLIITSMFFVVGTSILTMVASDYKNRINESKRVQNLYEADSGLDVVYNLIIKNSEAAIIYANSFVERMDNAETSTKSETFENKFMEFLGTTSITVKQASRDALEVTTSDSILAQGIDGFKYRKKNSAGNWEWSTDNITPEATVDLLSYEYDATDKKIIIGVRSSFFNTTGESKNQKTITTSFTVKAPKYTDSNIDIYPVFDKKIITADGDLSIEAGLSTEVESTDVDYTSIIGDVWVKGNNNADSEFENSSNKYNGGISLNKTMMKLTGNIYTNRTLNLGDNARTKIIGDVYGVNAYLGHQDGIVPNKLEIVGDLITNNDLTLNAVKGQAVMTNFYGINDKNITNITDTTDTDIDTDGEIEIAARNSSSIIINKESGNSLRIDNKAYIMGVAYLDTVEKYQTGESIAVKGNYLAYADVLPKYADRVELKYYNPLQLISKIDGTNASLSQKAQYFDEYYATVGKDVKTSEVDIHQVIATGAYVNTSSNTTTIVPSALDVNAFMNSKREDFASNVLSMGDITGVKTDDVLLNKLKIYNDGNVRKTVSNQIDFESIKTINRDSLPEEAIKSDGAVTIKGNTITYLSGTESKTQAFNSDTKLLILTEGNVTISETTNIKAVIIAEGNVAISGKLDLTGNIITAGNIEITDSDEKKLAYDADFTRGVVSENYGILSNLFIGHPKNESVNMGTNMYNVEDCITKGSWKIVK